MRARTPGSAGLLAQRLLALFVAGWVLFDFPLLSLGFGRGPDATLFGLPRLPVLLFLGWTVLIVLLAVLMERGDGHADGRGEARHGGRHDGLGEGQLGSPSRPAAPPGDGGRAPAFGGGHDAARGGPGG